MSSRSPLGILGAVWLVEFAGPGRLGRAVRFFAEVMTGIPSIVFGIFVYTLVVVATGSLSAVAGAMALALVMWPLVLTTAEEMLRQVPREVREAALVLGVPRRRVVVKVVLPTAAGGTGHRDAAGRGSGRRGDGAAAAHRLGQPVRLGPPGPARWRAR